MLVKLIPDQLEDLLPVELTFHQLAWGYYPTLPAGNESFILLRSLHFPMLVCLEERSARLYADYRKHADAVIHRTRILYCTRAPRPVGEGLPETYGFDLDHPRQKFAVPRIPIFRHEDVVQLIERSLLRAEYCYCEECFLVMRTAQASNGKGGIRQCLRCGTSDHISPFRLFRCAGCGRVGEQLEFFGGGFDGDGDPVLEQWPFVCPFCEDSQYEVAAIPDDLTTYKRDLVTWHRYRGRKPADEYAL
ncbi:MAG: hypothetical protein WC477_02275 [Patescibacteria group bacterium]